VGVPAYLLEFRHFMTRKIAPFADGRDYV